MKAHIVKNGVVINTIEVASLDFQLPEDQTLINGEIGGIGWIYSGGILTAPASVTTGAPSITPFSSLDYLGKFTDAEYAAVRSGPMALQRGLDSLIAAQFVDLDDPRTAAYLSGMVSAGIITEARKTELLTPQAA